MGPGGKQVVVPIPRGVMGVAADIGDVHHRFESDVPLDSEVVLVSHGQLLVQTLGSRHAGGTSGTGSQKIRVQVGVADGLAEWESGPVVEGVAGAGIMGSPPSSANHHFSV